MKEGDSVYYIGCPAIVDKIPARIEKIINGTAIISGNNEPVNLSELEANEIMCPECGEMVNRSDMNYTTDCHGIPLRLLCSHCYKKVMDKGYDGEYYD